MTLRLTPTMPAVDLSDVEQGIADAKAAAEAADARAGRAMQRANAAGETGLSAHEIAVKAEQDTLTLAEQQAALSALAADYEAALKASVQDRAELHRLVAEALSRTMTPGPAGKDGAAGKDGRDGERGPAGVTNLVVGVGEKVLGGSLAAGAATSVTIPLDKTMGSQVYAVGTSLTGGATLLGQLVLTGVTSKTETSVTVQVRNTGLAALANLSTATVTVVAARAVA